MIFSRLSEHWKRIQPHVASWSFSIFVVNATSYICSAPILIAWGLPTSALSWIGNIAFAPFLALFIIQCTLVLCCSLLGLSCSLFTTSLTTTTSWWLKALSFGSKRFLYGQIAHPAIVAIGALIALATGAYLATCTTQRTIVRTLIIGCCATTLLFGLPLTQPQSELTNRNGSLVITQNSASSITLEDRGFLKGLNNASKNAMFSVRRPILQTHGTLHVQKMATKIISPRTFEAIAELLINMDIKELELPYITLPQKPSTWRALARIRVIAREHNIKIRYKKSRA